MLITKKLYYYDPFLKKCHAKVIGVDEKGVVLDQTIAFPEGGGQEGDKGTLLILGEEKKIEFSDTQKGLGKCITMQDFPLIHVNTPIYHKVAPEYLAMFKMGMEVTVILDVNRRMRLAASHTATHLLLMGVESIYEKYESKIYGCHIKEEGGRLDFRTSIKFTQEDIKIIEEYVNCLIQGNYVITTFAHEKEPEAWYWQCKDVTYPCGGMHLLQTSNIKNITVKRKNLGTSGQRLSFIMNEILPFEELYHEND
jgi:Ser-tRNA(Ala) deacylase AlaX